MNSLTSSQPNSKPAQSGPIHIPEAGRQLDLVRFTLGGQRFALEISQVQEVVRIVDITRVPNADPGILGVMNLRGNIIPVIDLRTKYGLPSIDPSDRSRIIITQYSGQLFGFLVDGVSEIIHVNQGEIMLEQDLETGLDPACILGTLDQTPEINGKQNSALIVLTNLHTLFQNELPGHDDQEGNANAGK